MWALFAAGKMKGNKRTVSDADLDFPAPSSNITDPAAVLLSYADLFSETSSPTSIDEVKEVIAEIEERGLPHDADRRKVLFGTLMVWRGVVSLRIRFIFFNCVNCTV